MENSQRTECYPQTSRPDNVFPCQRITLSHTPLGDNRRIPQNRGLQTEGEETTMTPQQIHLVQSSFEKALPIADTVAIRFYDRLFQLDPALRSLFPGDITEQRHKLMATLHIAVHDLHRIEEILPSLWHLGRRHAEYGVCAVHYATV